MYSGLAEAVCPKLREASIIRVALCPRPFVANYHRPRVCEGTRVPSAYHASRQPSIGLSSRLMSGGRPRLVIPERRIREVVCPGQGSGFVEGLFPPETAGVQTGVKPPAASGGKTRSRKGGAKPGDDDDA